LAFSTSNAPRNNLLATGRYLTLFPGTTPKCAANRDALKALPVKLLRWQRPVAIVTLKGLP
jgi:hypothetical protein